jgi:CRISPR-associated protein Csx3
VKAGAARKGAALKENPMSQYTGYLRDGEWLCADCAPEGAEEVQDRARLGWGMICARCDAQITPEHLPEGVIFYSIGVEQPIGPEAPLPPCPPIPRGAVVVVEGRAPIWRYGMALHRLHGSAAAAIAFFDPRLGAVVVATHSPRFAEGQVLDVGLPR